MTLLGTFRNLAILVILTVAGLSLSSRPVAAQTGSIPPGAFCKPPYGRNPQCFTHFCSSLTKRCCWLFTDEGYGCTSNLQCCSGICNYNYKTGIGHCPYKG